MNGHIKKHGEIISRILKEEFNPYIKIEIDSEGIKMTSVSQYEPTEVIKNQKTRL